MKLIEMKRPFIICIAIIGIVVFIFIVNTGSEQLPITEKNIRTQLEQMYDAEVAEVKKNEDVYEAIIAKSGQVYLVEMNASTGDVNSLEHTDEFIIQEVPVVTAGTNEEDDGHEVSTKKTSDSTKVEIVESHIISSNGTTKLVIIEKPKESSSNVKIVENPNIMENKKSKQTADNKETKAPEKPMRDVIKDAIKDVLASETTKPIETPKEEIKKDSKTEVTTKAEVAKTEAAKAEVSKSETSKTESSKLDSAKTELAITNSLKTEIAKSETTKSETTVKTETSKTVGQQITESSEAAVVKTEEKKTEVAEKPVTVLITADEALKIANQQLKGILESNSFVKTNEGGYYLIVMTASKSEETKDTSAKDKKTKATIQVHAISGKVLSVTWE